MRSRQALIQSFLLVLAVLLPAAHSHARVARADDAAPAGDPVQQQLQLMQQELDRLRKDNEQMKDRIDDLQAQNNADWLTEARAEQIRGLVQDVLADADTRASLAGDAMTAGWSEHFFLASPNGKFKLILEGTQQIRWIWNFHDVPEPFSPTNTSDFRDYRHGFELTSTRLTFRGHVFSPDLQYLVRTDFFSARNGFAQLLDAWVRYNFDDHWSGRLGQFKLPFDREFLVSEERQLLVNRSLVSIYTSIGRSEGVELSYHDDANSWQFAYSNGATAVFLAGGPNNQLNATWSRPNTEYAFASRYERLIYGSWDQFKQFTSPRGEEFGMMWGIAGQAQNAEANSVPGQNGQTTAGFTTDLSVQWGGTNAFASFTYQYVDSSPGPVSNTFGLVGQGGIYILPKVELFARGEFMAVSSPADVRNLVDFTFGFNWYIEGQDVKWTTDFGFSFNGVDPRFANDAAGYRSDTGSSNFGADFNTETDFQCVIRTQFQLLF